MLYIIIALSASQFDVFSQVTDENLSFPTSEDLVNYTSEITPILASIPTDLITEKLSTTSCKFIHYIISTFWESEIIIHPDLLEMCRDKTS